MRFTGYILCCLLLLFPLHADRGTETEGYGIQIIEIVRPALGDSRMNTLDVIPHRTIDRPRIGLVLSGGGARGAAHLGVIEVLEEQGIPIDFIVGASMGSLIGGLYAIGYSTDAMHALVDTLDWDRLLSLSDAADRRDLFVDQKMTPHRGLFTLRFDGVVPVIPASVTPAQQLSSVINQLILQGVYHPDVSYDDLRIPFRSVATDLISGERVVFDSGDLVQAMRASISVPLMFAPVIKDSMMLVDGGLVSNIPVDIARDYGCDIVIAVNTTSGMRDADQIGAPWEVADQIITIMQQRWNRDQLELADIVITPPIENYLGSDFGNIPFFIEEGRRTAEEAVPTIKEQIGAYYSYHYRQDSVSYPDPSITFGDDLTGGELEGSLRTLNQTDTLQHCQLIHLLNTIYATGWYRDVYASVEREAGETAITILTERNSLLNRVRFGGNAHLEDGTLTRSFDDLIGKPVNHRSAKHALEEILLRYRSHGFSLARITGISYDEDTGELVISIDEGTVGAVHFRGNHRTRGYVVRREFPIRPGDTFHVDDAMRGIRNINGTGLFNQVMVSVESADGGPAIIVQVDERHSDLLRLSMRIDDVHHFQPLLELRNENLFGHGMETGVSVGGGLQNRLYMADMVIHRIFNTYLASRISAFYRFDDIPLYIDDPDARSSRWVREREGLYRHRRWGGNMTVGSQFERLGNISVTMRIEEHEIDEREAGAFQPTEYRLIAQRFMSIFDTYDRFPYPSEGVGIQAYYETANSAFGSEISYSKFYVSYDSYNTYGNAHTFRPRIVFGFADESLPLGEQFTFGGKDNFYGLREFDSRGRQILTINFEYRYKLPIKILVDTYIHARYDIGSVWNTSQDIRLGDLRHGIGIGLGFDTVIFGPIEFAVGRAFLSRGDVFNQRMPSTPIQTYFTIGYPLP
jgi:NTE family protein